MPNIFGPRVFFLWQNRGRNLEAGGLMFAQSCGKGQTPFFLQDIIKMEAPEQAKQEFFPLVGRNAPQKEIGALFFVALQFTSFLGLHSSTNECIFSPPWVWFSIFSGSAKITIFSEKKLLFSKLDLEFMSFPPRSDWTRILSLRRRSLRRWCICCSAARCRTGCVPEYIFSNLKTFFWRERKFYHDEFFLPHKIHTHKSSRPKCLHFL